MQACPKCGRELVVKHKGQQSFLGCSGYPDCEYTQGLREQSEIEPESLGVPCPQCGNDLQLKSGRFGLFVGCSNYPDCDFIAEDPTQREQDSVPCPECEKAGRKGRVVAKTGRSGKQFFSCYQFPTCDFSLPLPPVKEACPECDFPLLMRKRSQGSERLVCPQKHCDYRSKPL